MAREPLPAPGAAANGGASADARAVSFFKSFALDFHPISRLNFLSYGRWKNPLIYLLRHQFLRGLNYDVGWSGPAPNARGFYGPASGVRTVAIYIKISIEFLLGDTCPQWASDAVRCLSDSPPSSARSHVNEHSSAVGAHAAAGQWFASFASHTIDAFIPSTKCHLI